MGRGSLEWLEAFENDEIENIEAHFARYWLWPGQYPIRYEKVGGLPVNFYNLIKSPQCSRYRLNFRFGQTLQIALSEINVWKVGAEWRKRNSIFDSRSKLFNRVKQRVFGPTNSILGRGQFTLSAFGQSEAKFAYWFSLTIRYSYSLNRVQLGSIYPKDSIDIKLSIC